jgi:hypothetical protein
MYILIDKNNTPRITCYGDFNLEFVIALAGIWGRKKHEGGFLYGNVSLFRDYERYSGITK